MRIENDVYVKKGRRYRPIGSYAYRPKMADGIWLVRNTDGGRSESLIYRIGELPELDGATVAKLYSKKAEVDRAVSELLDNNKAISVADVVDAVFKAMGVVAAEMLEEEEKQ